MTELSRRRFLKTAASTGALLIAVSHAPRLLAADDPKNVGNVTACLRVEEGGRIVLCVPTPDMGQGMLTTAAQVIAEELDVSLDSVDVELMPFEGKFDHKGRAVFDRFYQGAGGSGSTMRTWNELRRTAAYARTLFVEAAAGEWGVTRSALKTENGQVINTLTSEKLAYTDLVDSAKYLDGDITYGDQPLKKAKDRQVVGKPQNNVKARAIVTGEPLFGIDAEPEGILHAAIRRCPHIKGDVVSYKADAIKAMPGVRHVVEMPRRPMDNITSYRRSAAGVAVVADTYWQARKAADALEIEWNGEAGLGADTALLKEQAFDLLEGGKMEVAAEAGDLMAAFEKADKTFEATYYHPHWAHTCLEPHSCVADVQADSAEIWVGHQFMNTAINAVTRVTDIPQDKVNAHFYRMGTGFGRKFEEDYIAEACILSKEIGAPVKVTWSREDEMEQDYINPIAAYRLRAALDRKGNIDAWHLRAAADTQPTVIAQEFPVGIVDTYKGEWAQIPNVISRGAWRGPHHNVAGWVIQSFLYELALKANRDPLEYLIALYSRKKALRSRNWPFQDHDFSRYVELLKTVQKKSGWKKPLKEGWGRGVAIHHTFVSTCAHVVEVQMKSETDFIIHKVTSAVDCGLVVNPLGAKAQIESGIHDGICAALYGEYRFEKGVPVTNNFDTYRKMRIDEAPREIDIHFVEFGDAEPRGLGEISLPPILPALTNAIHAASGTHIRELPIKKA